MRSTISCLSAPLLHISPSSVHESRDSSHRLFTLFQASSYTFIPCLIPSSPVSLIATSSAKSDHRFPTPVAFLSLICVALLPTKGFCVYSLLHHLRYPFLCGYRGTYLIPCHPHGSEVSIPAHCFPLDKHQLYPLCTFVWSCD